MVVGIGTDEGDGLGQKVWCWKYKEEVDWVKGWEERVIEEGKGEGKKRSQEKKDRN